MRTRNRKNKFSWQYSTCPTLEMSDSLIAPPTSLNSLQKKTEDPPENWVAPFRKALIPILCEMQTTQRQQQPSSGTSRPNNWLTKQEEMLQVQRLQEVELLLENHHSSLFHYGLSSSRGTRWVSALHFTVTSQSAIFKRTHPPASATTATNQSTLSRWQRRRSAEEPDTLWDDRTKQLRLLGLIHTFMSFKREDKRAAWGRSDISAGEQDKAAAKKKF